jgi:hypothetical protein
MKAIISTFFISILVISLFSCKKSSSNSNPSTSKYFISCTINGANKTFNVSTQAIDSNFGGGLEMVGIGGLSDTSGTPEGFDLSIQNDPTLQPITTGNYTDTSSSVTLNSDILSNYYIGISDANYFNAGTVFAEIMSGSGSTLTNHLKVSITLLSSTEIKGTFSGDYYANQDPSATSSIHTVTNGNFYLKLQ